MLKTLDSPTLGRERVFELTPDGIGFGELISELTSLIELATGREHGPFDSEADVALCLAFEKLDRHQVEVLVDRSPLEAMTGWE